MPLLNPELQYLLHPHPGKLAQINRLLKGTNQSVHIILTYLLENKQNIPISSWFYLLKVPHSKHIQLHARQLFNYITFPIKQD